MSTYYAVIHGDGPDHSFGPITHDPIASRVLFEYEVEGPLMEESAMQTDFIGRFLPLHIVKTSNGRAESFGTKDTLGSALLRGAAIPIHRAESVEVQTSDGRVVMVVKASMPVSPMSYPYAFYWFRRGGR